MGSLGLVGLTKTYLGFPELIVICSIVLHIWLLVPHELLLLLPTFFFG